MDLQNRSAAPADNIDSFFRMDMSANMDKSAAPLVPPRPQQWTSSPGYGFSGGFPGGYPGYTPFGTVHSGYSGHFPGYTPGYPTVSPFSADPTPENWFMQLADESTRDTFKSLESFVRVFTSISQMLDSTYMLLHSSFRTVVGVAGQLGQLKQQLLRLLSAITAVRTVRRLLRFVSRLVLGRRVDFDAESKHFSDPSSTNAAESVWRGAVESGSQSGASRWPLLVYLGVVFLAPYFMYRASAGVRASNSGTGWIQGSSEHYVATCSHPFTGQNSRELSLKPGQRLRLAPRSQQPSGSDWVLASDGSSVGLVPANHIKILRHVTGLSEN